jgi:hypothetical protein
VPNPCLLTFDDGLKDHREYVMPELLKRGLSGCFFIPSASSRKLELLDVHAIQFILETGVSGAVLLKMTKAICQQLGWEVDLNNTDSIDEESNRFDDLEVAQLKRLLQFELPSKIRYTVVRELFMQVRDESAAEIAEELYLNVSDLQEMAAEGMHIGPHGHTHTWLEFQSTSEQKHEVLQSVKFLRDIGVMADNWMFAYPYGSYNGDTINILENLGCNAAFTTNVDFSNLEIENPLALSRFDTNDYPQM